MSKSLRQLAADADRIADRVSLSLWANAINDMPRLSVNRLAGFTERERECIAAENAAHRANRRQSIAWRAIDAQMEAARTTPSRNWVAYPGTD